MSSLLANGVRVGLGVPGAREFWFCWLRGEGELLRAQQPLLGVLLFNASGFGLAAVEHQRQVHAWEDSERVLGYGCLRPVPSPYPQLQLP